MKVKDLFLPIVLAGAGLFAYDHFRATRTEPAELSSSPSLAIPVQEDQSWRSDRTESTADAASVQFKCDGRTHCSQMTSCEEATFFLQHCPNTQMDGNNDGEPCEQQWCN